MSEAENAGTERRMKDFRFASVQSIEQMTRGLGHVVMPLASSLELPHPDLMELIQLGQAVIQERNVREVAERIKERRGATGCVGGVVAADRVKPSLAGLLLSALRRAYFPRYAPPRVQSGGIERS